MSSADLQDKMVNSNKTMPPDIAHQLLRAEAFAHPVSHLKLLETHISWVILTGEYAYKIKKPVKLPFVDYSTLSQRAHFCHEELRLNAALAPEIYLRVVPIMNCAGKMRVDYDGIVVDYAVCMKEFPQTNIFDSLLSRGELTTEHVDQLARLVAGSHKKSQVSDRKDADQFIDQLRSLSNDNIFFLSSAFSIRADLLQLEILADWIDDEFDRLRSRTAERLDNGFIRNCHGDMHLQNIILFNGKVEVFDCIEFSSDLQFIDTINDIAFPSMDLLASGRADLASRLMTLYLEETADYDGLQFLKLYQVYRALIRAKVTLIRESSESSINSARRYLQTAVDIATEIEPILWITFGVSGSGKSTQAMQCVQEFGAVRVRSDVERTRMFPESSSVDKYSTEATDRVYQRLRELSQQIISARFSVVVDATFIDSRHRGQFAQLARDLGVPLKIIQCKADVETLKQRVQARKSDASEANVELIEEQLASLDPLSEFEKSLVQ